MPKPFAALLWSIALVGQATAQTRADPPDDEIVVVGQRNSDAVRDFVGELGAAPRSADQLARWDRRICPGVLGLRPRYAQFAIDRIAQRAFDVGLDVGEPGCRANVLIIVTPDPDAIARELFEQHRDALGYFYERGQRTLGRAALRHFVESDAPVRWWHVSRTVTRDGEAIGDTADGGPPVNLLAGAGSRLRRNTRLDFGAAFIVVDARRLEGMQLEALADYLAMVSLAQLDADADASAYPSILNLFSADATQRPAAMTEWDIGYLRGLYGATREASSARRQQGEIARGMEENANEE